MNRPVAMMVSCFGIVLCCGCAIRQKCLSHHEEPQPGWVSITGSMVPSATIPVESTGKSLVNCLLESRIVEILEHQRETQPMSASAMAGGPVREADVHSLLSLLQDAEKASNPASLYSGVLQEIEKLQLSYPHLLNGGDASSLGYVFDPVVSVPQDRARLELQIRTIEDHTQRQAATQAFGVLVSNADLGASRQENLALLNQLVTRDILIIEDSQKARSWTHTKIGELQAAAGARASESGNISALPSKAQALVQQLMDGANQAHQAAAMTAGSAATPANPADTVFAVVEWHKESVVVVPFDSVFDSPVGGLWLYPGDRVRLTRMGEMGLLDGQFGAKKIGLTGLTAKRGVVETEASKLKPLLYQVDELIDLRSNLVVITYPVGSGSLKLMMPYSPTPGSAGSATRRVARLQSYIGLHNGSVVTLDHTSNNPLLKRSRKLMEEAAAQTMPSHHQFCTTKELHADGTLAANHTDDKGQLPAVPIVSDTCKYVQQTSQDAWRSAENWWATIVP